MRTPVASKNAFAIADPIGAVGGSPEPDRAQPCANAAVLPALTSLPGLVSVVNSPGTIVVYLPGWAWTSVTLGESLKRRIGYVTQSRLVRRSFVNVHCS